MPSIEKCIVPENSFLIRYLHAGGYVDCYRTEIPGCITLADYIFTFYTTSLFKVERSILRWTLERRSSDLQARQLANGTLGNFAAWHVESRSESEILLCDLIGRTRSWLMADSLSRSGDIRTRLYFGSAVVPKSGASSIGFVFQALLGFHQIYSRLLLSSAVSRIKRQNLAKKDAI